MLTKELLDSYREPTKAHKTYQGVPNVLDA